MLFSEGNGPKIFSLLQDSFLCLPNSTLMPKLIAISTAIFFLFLFFFLNRSFHPLHTKERIKKHFAYERWETPTE